MFKAALRNSIRSKPGSSTLLRSSTPRSHQLRALSSSSSSTARNGSSNVKGLVAGLVGLALLASSIPNGSVHSEQARSPPSTVAPAAASDPDNKLISMSTVAQYNKLPSEGGQGLWVVIKGEVYDVTEFVDNHPGGRNIILKNAGTDVTEIYEPIHPPTAIADNLDSSAHVGSVDPSTVVVKQAGEESEKDRKRRIARENLPSLGSVLNLDDFERIAESILTDQAWAYYSSAADDEITKAQNRASFNRVVFRPRILRAIGQIDSSVHLVPTSSSGGFDCALPIYVSPAAMAKLGHPDGELNLTRGAGKAAIIQGISANASVGLDEMLDARQPGQPVIYQLYVNKDRAASERILRKVEGKGVSAVMLTVDAPVMGKRERDMRAKGEEVEMGVDHGKDIKNPGGGVAQAISGYIEPNLTWDDIKWFRKTCKLPLYLKGVQTVEDVELAAKHGVDGVVLSNHGGRSLEYAPAALDVLIDLRQRRPDLFDKVEVFMDGGVRRGTDVLKAVALGAKAVGLGRPFLYAQSGYGEAGVTRAIQILQDEIQRGMQLLGVTSLDQLTPEMVDVLPRQFFPMPARTEETSSA
ncbi:Cytochrome b5-like heme/steroid binding domain protein [Kalmanozyma brasiliensis GHG001]|uniref:L-lactate dehydrogenase (cytochrome) n=1 Tax=Kalmanozyma brasiliensis (strain GHG001) TaxID=1365824 RepID=V5F0D6_KALBG|nr:Cytochrome b5-like heme/steroid binding domain protein [Kalmanozyma brasiliensis GHG001]EST09753.1 Cytochrome b5-like heme/steroid binding domain protein [Kalmanozyma brasiliensis GHG001]